MVSNFCRIPPGANFAFRNRDLAASWTGFTVRGTLRRMTIILILAIALLVGATVQSRWVLLLPLAIGASVALVIAATGHGLGDTPIPFLVIVCTLVMIGGQGLRSRKSHPRREPA